LSNTGALVGAGAPQPLNALAGSDLDQPFGLDLDKKGKAKDLAYALDVVLWLEYEPPPGT